MAARTAIGCILILGPLQGNAQGVEQWPIEKFGKLTEQLNFCKKAVLFFDCIEEKRQLDAREFQLRLKIKERIFALTNFEEERWFQRSRCRWLTSGDRNTAYSTIMHYPGLG
ncbi:hypothetical protein FCM35_KLT17091 [Carex littledalei]|uniref:Uncharacterized protein n=1 Tax=Carex littledalei TaxID=544730 RepID=A0A833RQD6_9POAL|nr:hypothetical protein FCM35_KLT17091 [Carex littledalei]